MYLITGFPGFLGRHLAECLHKQTTAELVFLVQKKFIPLAKETATSIGLNKYQIISGDINKSDLGINDSSLLNKITKVYHLAAIYDLSVDKKLAQSINVEGTKNVIDFCKKISNFEGLHYVSTCYVSGRFEGTFKESDLKCGQKFNNHYEETKYQAEVILQQAMKEEGFKASIYRPGVIAGHSQTGFTPKFDGPYYILQWLARQGKKALLPKISNYDHYYVNIVPVDFVAKAIAALSMQQFSIGQVYQLAEPYPPSIQDFLDLCEVVMDKKIVYIPLPKTLASFSLRYIPFVKDFMKINPDTLDYFEQPTNYDTTNAARDLSKLGIECPEVSSYLSVLLKYMYKQEKLNTKAMI